MSDNAALKKSSQGLKKSKASNNKKQNPVEGEPDSSTTTTPTPTPKAQNALARSVGECGPEYDLKSAFKSSLFNPYLFPVLVTIAIGLTLQFIASRQQWTQQGMATSTAFFTSEVASHVLLPALPFVLLSYLGAEERALHLITVCGALNWLQMFYHYVIANWSVSWPDFFTSSGTTLFFLNTVATHVIWSVFVIIESYRQSGRIMCIPYLLGSFVFGVDTVAPIFFLRLKRKEENEPREKNVLKRVEKRKKTSYALLYALLLIVIIVVISPVAYAWAIAPGTLGEKLIEVMHNIAARRTVYILMLMFASCTSFFLPQIELESGPHKWYARFMLSILLAFNPGFGLAVVLMFRELTAERSFIDYKRRARRENENTIAIYFAGFLSVFIRFVVFSALGYAYSLLGMQTAMTLLFLFLAGEYILNAGSFNWQANKALASWVENNVIITLFDIFVATLMLLVAWQDSPFMPASISIPLISNQAYVWNACLILGVIAAGHMIWRGFSSKSAPLPALVKVLMCVSLALLLFAKYDAMEATCNVPLGKEAVIEDKRFEEQFGALIRDIVLDGASGSQAAQRLQHHKMHGCVLADFTINRLIAPQLKHGLFARTGDTHKAIVRFSNGARLEKPDQSPDVRAMSIKLLDVAGFKALKENELGFENTTQDFILLSSDYFFTNDIASYPGLIVANGQGTGALLKWVFHSWNPFEWRLSIPYLVYKLAMEGTQVANPLNWQYYSTTPYRLGKSSAVKYSARPCFGSINQERKQLDITRKEADPDHFLRGNMHTHLKEYDVCFDFMVQLQTDACAQPIEDPTVSWPGGWASVATIRIPKQQFLHRSQVDYCQSLSFNPWHALKEHKPLGAVNYARKPAYGYGGTSRRLFNGVNVSAEPTLEQFQKAAQGPVYVDRIVGAGNTIEYNYLPYPYPYNELPKRIQQIPASQMFDAQSHNRMTKWYLRTRFNFYAKDQDTNSRAFNSFTEPDDYRYMFESKTWLIRPLDVPDVANRWKEDEEFARQFIAGVNPICIRQANENNPLPALLHLTPKQLQLLNQKLHDANPSGNDTFQSLRDAGRLFFVDYEILDDIVMKEDRLFYSPIVVFYLDQNSRLMPLVIQLSRYGKEPNDVYIAPNNRDQQNLEKKYYLPQLILEGQESTKKDRRYSADVLERTWLFARMHVMAADALVHEMVSHLGLTHLAMEPIVIAFHRQLSTDHPIFQLMIPHFRHTLAINDFGRSTLLNPRDSVFDRIMGCGLAGSLQLMQKAYKRFKLVERSFPREMASRGFFEVEPGSSDDNLPGYYYRDDGFRLWNAIELYVTSVIRLADVYGPGDEADLLIQRDEQLQALKRELADPAMAGVPGVPEIDTAEALIELLTNIIFTCTAQHSAVNFGQFDAYAFVPNRPVHLTKPMPEDKNHITNNYLMAALPNEATTMDIISVGRVLSLPAYDQRDPLTNETIGYTLVGVPHPPDFPYLQEYHRFVQVLNDLQHSIDKRNSAVKVGYSYLAPTEAASSIAI